MIYQNENFGGNLEFRCGRHDRFIVSTHLHDYSELLYVRQGEAEAVVEGRTLPVPEKHLVFVLPNQLHEYHCQNVDVICAVFSNDLIPLFFRSLAGRNQIDGAVDMTAMADVMDRLHTLDHTDAVLMSGYLNLICAQVLKRARYGRNPLKDSSLYRQVVNYLSNHFTEEITLKRLAERFGYNEKYLSHSLHSLTGMNFRRLLCYYRIEYAKKLLTEEHSANISDIAMRSGFSALNTFNRVFKSVTGQKPSEFRNNAR